MSMLRVLIEGKEVMINESKFQYFQEVLGAELVGEVVEPKEVVKKVNKKNNNKKK
jgi:hypothetical protein